MTHRLLFSIAGMLLSTAMLGSCVEPMGLLPTGLAISSGDEQSGVAGQPLQQPVVVTVADGGGRAVEGAQIRWEVISGGGTIPLFSYTDATGRASATWTLGLVGRTQTARASVPSSSLVTFTATANAAANTLIWASEQLPPICPCPSGTWGGIWASSPSDVFAVGGRGTIRHFNGASWEQQSSSTTNSLDVVSGTSASDVFAGGTFGTILHYDGASWSPVALGSASPDLLGMWGSSPNDEFAVGYGSGIWHYDGSVWTQQTNTTCLVAVWGSSGRDVFAVGGLVSHYDGATWSNQNSSNCRQDSVLSGVWGSGP